MYEIIVFQGTTTMPVIGKDCETVRKMISKPYRYYRSTNVNMDYYGGFHISYNQENICVSMEILMMKKSITTITN